MKKITTDTDPSASAPTLVDLAARIEEDTMRRAFSEAVDDYAHDEAVKAWAESNNDLH